MNKQKQSYKYNFSFVIPVYNAEEYIAETVGSVLAQTMSFQDNCEIIFVNDGSTDKSEDVCLSYKEKFPDNVTYVAQKNAGPGAARNNGINHAQGKYIVLLDSDDKFSSNTLEEVYRFFEEHYDEIDLVSIKWEFFEARTGQHPLNYKFTTNRVIDLTKEYTSILGVCTSVFFKESMLRKHLSDPAVGRYEEDARLMGEILLDNPKYGVVTKPTYFYRKRRSETSSQDLTRTDKFWYLETPKRVWYELFEYVRAHNEGYVPKFIQCLAMYNLQWRFRQQTQDVLSEAELKQYKSLLYGLLPAIDDDIILEQHNINVDQKIFILSKKHQEPVLHNATLDGGKYIYRGLEIYNFRQANIGVHIEFLEADQGKLRIEGYFGGLLKDDMVLEFHIGQTVYETEQVDVQKRRLMFLDEIVSERSRFKVTIPVEPGDAIGASITGLQNKLPFITHRFSHLSQSAKIAYRVCGPWLIRKYPTELRVRRYRSWRRAAYEIQYQGLLAKRLKLRVFLEQFAKWRQTRAVGEATELSALRWAFIPAKSMVRNAYVVTFRLLYFMTRPFVRKQIWLISDRIMAADDSGEILFRYLQERPDCPAKIYFTLSKKSNEYAKLQQYGEVINHGSFRHKLLFLLSSKVISSEATEGIINVFDGWADDLIDLYGFDFVFLQHGIIRDDISSWLNRYNKNIKLFVTSVKPEFESIVKGNYGYDESVVKLTGLPRYDKLRNEPKNKLIIVPTWRENLAGRVDFKTGNKQYNPKFKHSEYFAFYQDLMNDHNIRAAMQEQEITGEFYLHPSFQLQIKDFSGNDDFKIMQMPFDYPNAKSEGNLLVTDYSSVAFDFAYLKKPVIYTQFDEDSFYMNHVSKEGYFKYDIDGFGPVVYDYGATVKQIIETIKSGCKMNKIYADRVDGFFAFTDRNNAKRVYEAIVKMDNP